jgi:hypothetical protein
LSSGANGQFDQFWSRAVEYLKSELGEQRPGREERLFVANWRPDRGFLEEKFAVRDVGAEKITCVTIFGGKPVDIPRDDMATLYNLWDDFLSGRMARIEVVEKVPRTTYAISLMKYLKDNVR